MRFFLNFSEEQISRMVGVSAVQLTSLISRKNGGRFTEGGSATSGEKSENIIPLLDEMMMTLLDEIVKISRTEETLHNFGQDFFFK